MSGYNEFNKDTDKSRGQYQCGTYTTTSGVKRTNIHIFTTEARSRQRLVPIISVSQRVNLSSLNPNPSVAAATSVIAKINGNVFDYTWGPIGINYEGEKGNLYISENKYKTAPASSPSYREFKYSPSFCVKKDGTATIRWFKNSDLLQKAMNACDCIIAAAHPLVFDGKCIMTRKIYDHESTSHVIYDPNPSVSKDDMRYDFGVNNSDPAEDSDETAKRTCLGHISDSNGKYILVCADSGMTIWDAAHLMQSLGCDYAVNLDGAISTQMRIKNGYGPINGNGLVTTHGNPVYAGVAVCTV